MNIARKNFISHVVGLILDEPTAALDEATKTLLLDRIRQLAPGRHILMITHDVDAARAVCGEVAILYGGRIIETGPTSKVLANPRHPYTRGLMRANPGKEKQKDLQGIPGSYNPFNRGCAFYGRCTQSLDCCRTNAPVLAAHNGRLVACHRGGIVCLLNVCNITKSYGGRIILDRLSLRLLEGETLALVGPSGSGKSTLARLIMGLEFLEGGEVRLEDRPVHVNRERFTRTVQYIAQNPRTAISRRFTVLETVAEPLDIQRRMDASSKRERVLTALQDVQLPVSDLFLKRRPPELSGGELQRLAIARALVCDPKIVVADEPTSALDVSIQAKIMRLILDLQERRGLTLLFITHDLALAHKVGDRVVHLKPGKHKSKEPVRNCHTSIPPPVSPRTTGTKDTLCLTAPRTERENGDTDQCETMWKRWFGVPTASKRKE